MSAVRPRPVPCSRLVTSWLGLALTLGACGSAPAAPTAVPLPTRSEDVVTGPAELRVGSERLELVPAIGDGLLSTDPVAVHFLGSRSAIVRRYQPLGVHGYDTMPTDPRFAPVFELETSEGDVPAFRRRLGEPPRTVRIVPGDAVVLAYGDHVERRRSSDGEVTARAALGGAVLANDAEGRVLLAVDSGAVVLDRELAVEARLDVGGTANSVMRIYTGEHGPTYHETVPIEVPAQVVSAAFGAGGTLALATSDGAVHLVSPDRATTRRVALDVPVRPADDYPGVAAPLALHFRDEHTLHVAMAYGAILEIDVDTGQSRTLHPATCAPQEIEGLLAPFPGDRRDWTVRTYCEEAGSAAFSPDGSRLASRASMGIRVRDVPSGAPLRTVLSNATYGLSFRDASHLAILDVYGEREEIALLDGSTSPGLEGDAPTRFGVRDTVAVYPERDLVLSFERIATEAAPAGRDDSPRPAHRVAAWHLDGTAHGFVRERLFVAASAESERLATYDALSGEVTLCDREGRVLFARAGLGLEARYHGLGVSPDGAAVLLASDGMVQRVSESEVSELSRAAGVVEGFRFGGDLVAFTRFSDAPWGFRLEVRTLSGALVLDTDVGQSAFALSADGSTLAYVSSAPVAGDGEGSARTVVIRHPSGGEIRRIPLENVQGLALDGERLLWAGGIDGLMRQDGSASPVGVGVGALGLPRATFGSETYVVEDGAFGAHVIRARDDAHLATIHGLGSGFVVISRRGAIDGTSDLATAFVTVAPDGTVREASAETIRPLRVPGLLARALRGEDVAPSP